MAPRSPLAVLLLLSALLLVSTGCRENAGAAFARAEARYQTLLEGGKPAHDPGFTEVLEELAKVPSDSPFSTRARRLEEAIAQARARRPPIPLATGGHGGADGGIEALRDACEELARRMGVSQYETERKDLERRLLACRERVLKLRDELHHEATPETEHSGH